MSLLQAPDYVPIKLLLQIGHIPNWNSVRSVSLVQPELETTICWSLTAVPELASEVQSRPRDHSCCGTCGGPPIQEAHHAKGSVFAFLDQRDEAMRTRQVQNYELSATIGYCGLPITWLEASC